jgi:hypothetical protein
MTLYRWLVSGCDNPILRKVEGPSWPIVLKNSVFETKEILLAPQIQQKFLDTREYQKQWKIRYGKSGTAGCKISIGFSRSLAFSGKSAFLRFGIFPQNRPSAALAGFVLLAI